MAPSPASSSSPSSRSAPGEASTSAAETVDLGSPLTALQALALGEVLGSRDGVPTSRSDEASSVSSASTAVAATPSLPDAPTPTPAAGLAPNSPGTPVNSVALVAVAGGALLAAAVVLWQGRGRDRDTRR